MSNTATGKEGERDLDNDLGVETGPEQDRHEGGHLGRIVADVFRDDCCASDLTKVISSPADHLFFLKKNLIFFNFFFRKKVNRFNNIIQ